MYYIKNDEKLKKYDYLNPDEIYIPIPENYKLCFKTKEIKKGITLFSNEKNNVYSPISGIVKGVKEVYINDVLTKTMVIENDFKEEKKSNKGAVKNIDSYNKQDILNYIEKYRIGSFDFSKENLVVSFMDIDPYEKTYESILKNKMIDILDTIDLLSNKFKIKNTYVIVGNKENDAITNLINNLGSYPNIKLKLIPEMYPIGRKDIMIDYLKIDNECFITIEDVLNIYNALRNKKGITEKYITLSGNAIKEHKILYVKVGTFIKDVIKENADIINKKYKIIVNGIINGKTLNQKDNIISETTRSIFVSTIDDAKEMKCIKCGLCIEKCPKKLNPIRLKKDNRFNQSKCIKCGLCSYICPSNINFKNSMEDDNNE